jgi:outer membrane lipoprotein-sorting protein
MKGVKSMTIHAASFWKKCTSIRCTYKQRFILITFFGGVFAVLIGILQIAAMKSDTIIHDMAKAYEGVAAYHGIQTIYRANVKGEKTIFTVREIWSDREGRYYIEELEGLNQGIVTISNGQHKWQLNPKAKTVQILPIQPDTVQFIFEIGHEISSMQGIKRIKKVDEDMVAGRATRLYQVTTKGREIYCLWLDQETKLPVKKRTAPQDELAYEITYTQIEYVEKIPSQLLILEQPDGYTVRTNQTEQIVACTEEAYGLIGVYAKLPVKVPENYMLLQTVAEISEKVVKLYYVGQINKGVAIIDIKNASEELKPSPLAILGTVNLNQAEILVHRGKSQAILGNGLFAMEEVNSIRWQEEGIEYRVYGSIGIDILADFAEGISEGEVVFPETRQDIFHPEVVVEYDKKVEENEQKNVDAGHSPWKLDPVFVSQVYVSTIMKPGGIIGDYPIAYEDITITMNTGDAAIAKIYNEISPIKNVYLRKLIRQDETGIWTVVGYDKK